MEQLRDELNRLRERQHRLSEHLAVHELEAERKHSELAARIDQLAYTLGALGEPRRVLDRLQRIERGLAENRQAQDRHTAALRDRESRKLTRWQLTLATLGGLVVFAQGVLAWLVAAGVFHAAG